MLRRPHLAAALALLAACNPAPRSSAPDGGAPAATATPPAAVPGPASTPATLPSPSPSPSPASSPSPAATPAPGAASAPLPVQAFASANGAELPLPSAGEPATVDPRSAFRVEAGVPLTDAHAVLLDDKGDMVPSSGTTELGQASARFLLTPREPLVPGSRYTLKVETAGAKELRDAQGRVYAAAAVTLRTSGTRPAAPPPAHKRKKAHRRR